MIGALAVLSAAAQGAERCGRALASPALRTALDQIEASVDPCGETAAIRDLIQRFRTCAANARLCLDDRAPRNVTETGTAQQPTTITWNPTLRTELEAYCLAGDGPLLRDPLASLLHEIVHAVQDCDGLDIGAHELEAVQMENVYRRARGLCQRTGYGDEPLPAARRIACGPGACPCTPGDERLPHGVQSAMATGAGDPAVAAFDAAGSTAAAPAP